MKNAKYFVFISIKFGRIFDFAAFQWLFVAFGFLGWVSTQKNSAFAHTVSSGSEDSRMFAIDCEMVSLFCESRNDFIVL